MQKFSISPFTWTDVQPEILFPNIIRKRALIVTQSDAVILILSLRAVHPRLKLTGHLSFVSETEAILSREMKRGPSHVVFSEGGLCSYIVGDCLLRERQGHCQPRSVSEREVCL